jgi:hypothetical protein
MTKEEAVAQIVAALHAGVWRAANHIAQRVLDAWRALVVTYGTLI